MDKVQIILVPFFGAKPAQLLRHEAFFKKHNYSVTIVKLSQRWTPYIGENGKFGMKSKWTDEISQVLDQVQGPKVVFAFSNPGASAIEAIVRRTQGDVLGLICDSGPSGDFYQSVLGLLEHHIKIKNVLIRFPMSIVFYMFWSPGWNQQVKNEVAKLAANFPILSIQCGEDLLISPTQIDQAFAAHPKLKMKKLILPQVAHLMGLRQNPEIYQAAVLNFLTELKDLH